MQFIKEIFQHLDKTMLRTCCPKCVCVVCAEAKFCKYCGTQVRFPCKALHCNAEYMHGDKFCSMCGIPTKFKEPSEEECKILLDLHRALKEKSPTKFKCTEIEKALSQVNGYLETFVTLSYYQDKATNELLRYVLHLGYNSYENEEGAAMLRREILDKLKLTVAE